LPAALAEAAEALALMSVTAANTADREVIGELLAPPGTGATGPDTGDDPQGGSEPKGFEVYGDSAYAGGATLDEQAARGHDMRAKVPAARNPNGYSKDRFTIDLAAGTVTCPAQRDHRPGRASPCDPLRGTMRLLSAAGGLHQSPPDPAWQQAYREHRRHSSHQQPHQALSQQMRCWHHTQWQAFQGCGCGLHELQL
jgi:hypothetical protein